MKRREFIALAGGAAAWPVVGRPQQAGMPVIGYLNPGTPTATPDYMEGFRRGLAEAGYVEGRNVTIEYSWADNHYERLPSLAADLVRHRVDVIAACGSSAPGLAAKAATTMIPIVFQTGADPVVDRLVVSMNHPGGNVTGVSRLNVALDPKRLELLHEVVPAVKIIGFLVNSRSPRADDVIQQIQEPAGSLGIELVIVKTDTPSELDGAFDTMVRKMVGGLLVAGDPSMDSLVEQITALTIQRRIPAMFSSHLYVAAGGLMSYNASVPDSFRQVGTYVGRILKGESPADLPVLQPTKFELVINLKTAKALGLNVPPNLLALADEVIE